MKRSSLIDRIAEVVVLRDVNYYEHELTKAFAEREEHHGTQWHRRHRFREQDHRELGSDLSAVIEAGWIITGSWPIDTEKADRMSAMGQRRWLPPSISSAARARIRMAQSGLNEIGDWRDVLQELPRRIHEWMPRLAQEGVVGADAIFACLGPALEIFSRYSRVEKPNGDRSS